MILIVYFDINILGILREFEMHLKQRLNHSGFLVSRCSASESFHNSNISTLWDDIIAEALVQSDRF